MAKVRVSQHSGREGSARHNDRSFMEGLSPDQMREVAPHIRPELMAENVMWSVHPDEADFREAELRWYRERYGAAIERRNAAYRHEGHAERCKTVENVYTGAQTRPEEVILQIGDMNAETPKDALLGAFRDYMQVLDEWNKAHGGHMHVLSWALHVEEASPHIHLRRVWDVENRHGEAQLGQNKALKAAGVQRPDPGKPEGRYNNPKITFDAWARGQWQRIAQEHGFEVETEARHNLRHKDKADFVSEQLQRTIAGLREQIGQRKGELEGVEEALAKVQRLCEQQEQLRLNAQQQALLAEAEAGRWRRMSKSLQEEVRALDVGLAAAREEVARAAVKRGLLGLGKPRVELSPEAFASVQSRAVLNAKLGTLELREDAIELHRIVNERLANAEQQAKSIVAAAEREAAAIEDKAMHKSAAEQLELVNLQRIREDHPELFQTDGTYKGFRASRNKGHSLDKTK